MVKRQRTEHRRAWWNSLSTPQMITRIQLAMSKEKLKDNKRQLRKLRLNPESPECTEIALITLRGLIQANLHQIAYYKSKLLVEPVEEYDTFKCSCGQEVIHKWVYCPKCGVFLKWRKSRK